MLFARAARGAGIMWGPGLNFTEEVRRTLARARDESGRLGHEYVGTEHLLLALAGSPDVLGHSLLLRMDVDVERLRADVHGVVKSGHAAGVGRSDLPYTSRAKKVLEFAITEARELNQSYIGTEHLLLGLVAEHKGIAAQILGQQGVTLSRVRAVTREMLAESTRTFRIEIDDTSDVSIYEQIVARVQEGIATGALAPGERLPTVRQLADELDIAPGTVARAYGELERLGAVVTDGARGTRVAERRSVALPVEQRRRMLLDMLRPAAVAAFHAGATAAELRDALEAVMHDIFEDGPRQ